MPFGPQDVSICIPTYERGPVLAATLERLVGHTSDLLVLDQTPQHPPPVAERLHAWERSGAIRRIRLPQPAIPQAMNVGLREAKHAIVLFLDDDIEPAPRLVDAHAAAYGEDRVWAVAGQVLQPGQRPEPRRAWCTQGFRVDLDFPFNSTERAFVQNGIACNLSVHRGRALALGGFDESFEGAAYRFETEFCRRLHRGGGRVLFEPSASVNHLQAPRGGTRALGRHLASASPRFGVGDYYFALREPMSGGRWAYVASRPLREVATRFHLRHPWWIPIKLVGEARALSRALWLAGRPPALLRGQSGGS